MNDKCRVWRKLHVAVDVNMHEIIIAEQSLLNATDGKVLPNLLKQTCLRINKVSGNAIHFTKKRITFAE